MWTTNYNLEVIDGQTKIVLESGEVHDIRAMIRVFGVDPASTSQPCTKGFTTKGGGARPLLRHSFR